MARACEPDACTYDSHCYSNGATRSNGGVCQECSAGKWVGATGCTECGNMEMHMGGGMKMGKKGMPCDKMHHPGQ
jgi:hypothetical protein